LIDQYVTALESEIKRVVSPDVEAMTIYFGGGTPSLLASKQVKRLLDACRFAFKVLDDPEVTLEANPGTLDYDYLQELCYLGVNRLSLGAQSFDDDNLRTLGRAHRRGDIERAFGGARRAGFGNISLDLIYGLPHQDLNNWCSNLISAVELEPEHISLYPLTLDLDDCSGAIRSWRSRMLEVLPSQDEVAEMYEEAEETLAAAGYEHYEISNWARPGFECEHNLGYWQYRPYLGFGAGAHSFLPAEDGRPARRWSNAADLHDYLEKQRSGRSLVDFYEELSLGESKAEAIFLALRLGEGLDLTEFERQFGQGLQSLYAEGLLKLEKAGLLQLSPERVSLTARGRLLGNEVFAEFLP